MTFVPVIGSLLSYLNRILNVVSQKAAVNISSDKLQPTDQRGVAGCIFQKSELLFPRPVEETLQERPDSVSRARIYFVMHFNFLELCAFPDYSLVHTFCLLGWSENIFSKKLFVIPVDCDH